MQHYYIRDIYISTSMNLDMFTTYDIATAVSRSYNKNEQIQALLLVKNGLSPAKVAEDFSVPVQRFTVG